MTDTYPSTSAPPPAVPQPPRSEPQSQPPEHEEIRAGAEGNPAAAPEHDGERQVWQPPAPQYPARPSVAPPVQYTGPRPQPTPSYMPPQQQQPTAPQPPYMQPPQGRPAPGQAYPYGGGQSGQGGQQTYIPVQGSQAAQMTPGYNPPQQVFAPPPSPQMSRTRVGRRLMRRVVRGGGGLGKLFSGVRLPLTLLFLVLIGVVTWQAIDRSKLQAANTKPNAVAAGTIVLPPESNTVTTYLGAFKGNDVEAAWNTLSPKEKVRRIDQGEDKAVMKEVLKQIAANNVNVTYRFVGAYGSAAPNDFSKGGIYYYVMDVATQGQVVTKPMYFVVDDQGKVDQVSDWLYRAIMSSIGGN